MVLELILVYGLLVGAIVGMDHVLPGYEGDQFLASSRGQVPRYLNSREIMSGLEQLEPDISTSETISGLASDMRPSMDNGHNLDQSVEEQEDITERDPGKKVMDKGGNDSRGKFLNESYRVCKKSRATVWKKNSSSHRI